MIVEMDMKGLGVLAVCATAIILSDRACAETAEQRAGRAAAFEAAYKALDPKDKTSGSRFAELVAAELKSGIPVDEFLGFMIDSGLDCMRVDLPEGPANQPPVEYYCTHSFITPEEADRQAWSLVKTISRADAVAHINGNRIVTSIDASTLYGAVGP
mgnify:CR=1 FL=1